jgi:hypothetical protein
LDAIDQIIDDRFNGRQSLGAKLFARSQFYNQQQATLPKEQRGPANLL